MIEEKKDLPDLIVIDGGKGQLSAAVASLKAVGIYDQVPVIGIAKRLEEIYYPGDPYPIHISKQSASLKLIQQLRLAMGARQLVVQEALEIIGSFPCRVCSFTPNTTVGIFPWAGAEMTTRCAPAVRCLLAPSWSVNRPVASSTIVMPKAFQGSCAGSGSLGKGWTKLDQKCGCC